MPKTMTVKRVLALRECQRRFERIANDPALRATAREAAAREIARIETAIRG
jgi:hypothetical protein